MSFDITFYTNESETTHLDKDLTLVVTLTGTLRDGSSIINPSILVAGTLATLKIANYFYIEDFGRYYFLGDMHTVRTGLIEVTGHVDVLSTYKTCIRANKGIVYRQEERWNLYLNDGVLEVYQNPIVTTHEFPSGFSGQSYVLAVAGSKYGPDWGSGLIPGGGGNNLDVKTSAGLASYVLAQLGLPYWYGTFGQTADASLYANRKANYPGEYTASDFPSQYGQRVHDCVGLVKGYRWSETPTSVPVYNQVEDVSAAGLFQQCSRIFGAVGDANWTATYAAYPGICLFKLGTDPYTGRTNVVVHVGVSMGDGTAIEARGHSYGVVRTNIADRDWAYWGQPDWMADNLGSLPV